MHHKLLSSRLLESKMGLLNGNNASNGIPLRSGGDSVDTGSPVVNTTNTKSGASDKYSKRAKKDPKHVPLNGGLAKIVSLELASDDGGGSIKKGNKSTTGRLTPHHHQSLQQALLSNKRSTHLPLVAPSSQPASSYLHQQVPMMHHSAAAMLAARMAEEQQDAVSFFLQQRQQQSHRQLEQLQMEQIRRMQAAMLFYQQQTSVSSPTGLPFFESLLAGRHTPGSLTSCDLFHPQRQTSGAVQLNQSVGQTETKTSKTVIPTAGASGANPSLLSLAPKRDLEDSLKKPIKERPEEYQHLSKKVKRMPPVPPKVPPTTTGQINDMSNTDHDEDSDCTDDPDKNGHRFRPYQYEQWTEKFQELCDFRKIKGHCQVPHTYKENPPLARWVKRQRYQYKLKVEGKMSTMTDERVQLLENIGFIWDSHAAAWAEKLHELKDYARQRGDCNVPSTFPENPQLATWVKCQRRQYKLLRDGKTSNMTVDRILELEKVGFVWEVRKTWEHTPNGMERVPPAMVAPSS